MYVNKDISHKLKVIQFTPKRPSKFEEYTSGRILIEEEDEMPERKTDKVNVNKWVNLNIDSIKQQH